MREILAGSVCLGTERAADDDFASTEIRREIEIVNPQVHQSAAIARARSPFTAKIERDEIFAYDEARQRPHDRVESLGMPDEETRPAASAGHEPASFSG